MKLLVFKPPSPCSTGTCERTFLSLVEIGNDDHKPARPLIERVDGNDDRDRCPHCCRAVDGSHVLDGTGPPTPLSINLASSCKNGEVRD